MTKLSRFERSQRAHYSLHFKHQMRSIGNPRSEVKADYHYDVSTIQRKAGKILPRNERKILYKYNLQRVFPAKKNIIKRSSYLGVFKKYNVGSY